MKGGDELIGKTVAIMEEDLLAVFYPDFVMKEEVTMLDRDKKIIYKGRSRPKLKEYLANNTKSFISLVGVPEISLKDKKSLLNYVAEKKAIRLPKGIEDDVEMLDDESFISGIKILWTARVWPYQVTSDSDVTVYHLFKETIGPIREHLDVYFKVLDRFPFYVVEASYLTFLQRVLDIEEQEVSPHYKRLLRSVHAKSGTKIRQAVFDYSTAEEQNDLSLLGLLLGVR